MKRRTTMPLLLALGLVVAVLGTTTVMATGTATASGQIETKSTENHCRVGANDKDVPAWGWVEVLNVTVLDKFGRKKEGVTWEIVGGAGSSRPTVKVTPPMDNADIIQIELKTQKANPDPNSGGNWGFVGVHCY